jgi:hypothetical protein
MVLNFYKISLFSLLTAFLQNKHSKIRIHLKLRFCLMSKNSNVFGDDVGGGNGVCCTLLIKVMIVETVHLIIFDELFYLITIGSSCWNLLIFSSLFKLHTNKEVYCVLNYKKIKTDIQSYSRLNEPLTFSVPSSLTEINGGSESKELLSNKLSLKCSSKLIMYDEYLSMSA